MLADLIHNYQNSKIQHTVYRASKNAVSYALVVAICKIYSIIFNNEVPLAVVLTGSMEPAYHRGDIIHLNNSRRDFYVGDQICFRVNPWDEIPIVHRIIKVINKKGSTQIRSKGDNNNEDDRFLYNKGQNHISSNNIIARVVANVPFLGHMSIFMKEKIIMTIFFAYTAMELFYE